MRSISFFITYLVSTAKKYFSLFTDMNRFICRRDYRVGEKKSITQLKWINRLQKQCMIDIYSWVSCFCTLTYHFVPPKLNMASHLFVHNILALIGKWWSIHHGSIGHWICKEAAHSRILTSRWHFGHIITWTIVVLVVHGWRNRTGVIEEKRTSTGWRCSGSGFCCMEKNNFSNT